MKIITVANLKGGVGKTTSVMNLANALARAGKKVLAIDSDPQANLTSYCGVAPGTAPHEDLRTLDELYLSKRPLDARMMAEFITPTISGFDLLPSDRALSGVEFYLFSRPDKEFVLDQFVKSLRGTYDYILIDTPPSWNLLTINALCASDRVLIPVQAEFFSLEGIIKIRQSIEEVKIRWNPRLTILGVLPTQLSARRKLTQDVLAILKSEIGDLLFDQSISDNASIAESSGHAQSVIDYDHSSKGAQDYLAAAAEMVARLEQTVARVES